MCFIYESRKSENFRKLMNSFKKNNEFINFRMNYTQTQKTTQSSSWKTSERFQTHARFTPSTLCMQSIREAHGRQFKYFKQMHLFKPLYKFHGQSILKKTKAKLSIHSLKTRWKKKKSHRIDSSTVSVCISCGKVSLLDT